MISILSLLLFLYLISVFVRHARQDSRWSKWPCVGHVRRIWACCCNLGTKQKKEGCDAGIPMTELVPKPAGFGQALGPQECLPYAVTPGREIDPLVMLRRQYVSPNPFLPPQMMLHDNRPIREILSVSDPEPAQEEMTTRPADDDAVTGNRAAMPSPVLQSLGRGSDRRSMRQDGGLFRQ